MRRNSVWASRAAALVAALMLVWPALAGWDEGLAAYQRHDWAKAAADHVVIEITDQGPGIPAGDREKVFDMFYRVNQSDSQSAGTGLGLAICRGIIEAHGGTIRAEAGLHGTGTAMIIHLPLPPEIDLRAESGEG